jgi:phospholipid/cholesterol/gamma-HCH transport system permease protein
LLLNLKQAILLTKAAVDAYLEFDKDKNLLTCMGEWDIAHLPAVQHQLANIRFPKDTSITINGAGVKQLDSAGAWQLLQIQNALSQQNCKSSFNEFAPPHQELIDIITKTLKGNVGLPKVIPLTRIQRLGKLTTRVCAQLQLYLAFLGQLSVEFLRVITHPKHFRINSYASVIYQNGYLAIPIITLLSFMIGVVITYQMGLQLKNYGANIFIVDLLGLAILREFGPLLTAIMIAGRTGSAFTAHLGMMKLNQEIDALDTMGVTPGELLLLPRVIGMVIVLPLITIWADIIGVFGGMIMSNSMLNITWYDFLHRFPKVIPLRSLLVGLGKTPIFALLIASIGCFQGMQVKEGAASLGQNTTRSVVMAIFFIIVADAIFSVVFSKMHL